MSTRNRTKFKTKTQPPTWKVTADNVNGSKPGHTEIHHTLEMAKVNADWLNRQPGLTRVEIEVPKRTAPLTYPTPEDIEMGAWLAAALEDPKVSPCMKYDINVWMDSKAWS